MDDFGKDICTAAIGVVGIFSTAILNADFSDSTVIKSSLSVLLMSVRAYL